jgi:hypothetical protein
MVMNAWKDEYTLTNEDFFLMLVNFRLEEEFHFWLLKNHPKDATMNIHTLLDVVESVVFPLKDELALPDQALFSFLSLCLKTCELFNSRDQKNIKLWMSFFIIENDAGIKIPTREVSTIQNHLDLMTCQQENRLRGLIDDISSKNTHINDEIENLRAKIETLMERIVPSTLVTDRTSFVIGNLPDSILLTSEKDLATGVIDHDDTQTEKTPIQFSNRPNGHVQKLMQIFKDDNTLNDDKISAAIQSVARILEVEKDMDALAFYVNYLLIAQIKLLPESSNQRHTFMSKLGKAHPFSQEIDKMIQKTFNTLTSSKGAATDKDVFRIMRLLEWQPYSIMEQMIQNSIRSKESNATFLSVLYRCPSLIKFTFQGSYNVLSVMTTKCLLERKSSITMEVHRRNLLELLKRLVELQLCSIDFLMTEVLLMIPVDDGFKASKVLKFLCEFKKMFNNKSFVLKNRLTPPKLTQYLVNGYSTLLDAHAEVDDLVVILEDTLLFIQQMRKHFNSEEKLMLPIHMDVPLNVCLSNSASIQEDNSFELLLWKIIFEIRAEEPMFSKLEEEAMKNREGMDALAHTFLRCGPIFFEKLYQNILPHLKRFNLMYETLQWGDKQEIILKRPAGIFSLDQLEKLTGIFHRAVRLNVSPRLRFSISLSRNLVFAVEKAMEDIRIRTLDEQFWIHLRCLQIICFILSTMSRYMKEVVKDSDSMRPLELVLGNVLYGLDGLRREWITTAVTPHDISQVHHFIAYWISRIHQSIHYNISTPNQ